jgi:hypothetical protein
MQKKSEKSQTSHNIIVSIHKTPKKIQMISSNWYYASHIGMKISR